MRIFVFLNNQAGQVAKARVKEQMERALFRCKLEYFETNTVEEMQREILNFGTVETNPDILVLCGGDGTLNCALKPLMELRERGLHLPSVCVLPLGTANDLATELGLSTKVERAARLVMEGKARSIDIIEISDGTSKKYMITNGGVGLAAKTAQKANDLKSKLRAKQPGQKTGILSLMGQVVVEATGSRLYETLLAADILLWKKDQFSIEIDLGDQGFFKTSSPFVMVNNQTRIGSKFIPAPYTHHSDSYFNVMWLEARHRRALLSNVLNIRKGNFLSQKKVPSFETQFVRFRSPSEQKKMTFFGDGEILFEDAVELTLRCLSPGLTLITKDDA